MIGVLEFRRLPVLGHVVDQASGEVDLLAGDTGALEAFGGQLEAAGAPQLIGVAHGDQHQGASDGSDHREMLRRADDHLRDRDAAALLEGLAQQRIDLLASPAGYEVIGRLEVLRRDFLRRHERLDVDRPCRLDVGAAKVLFGEHDVPVLVVFVALDDVVPRNFLAALLVVALVPDRREVVLVEHRKLEFLAFFGGKQLDRHIDESEADGAFPERASHDLGFVLCKIDHEWTHVHDGFQSYDSARSAAFRVRR